MTFTIHTLTTPPSSSESNTIPALASVWRSSFSTPMIPPTAATKTWMSTSYRFPLLPENQTSIQTCFYFYIKDSSIPDQDSEDATIAFARYFKFGDDWKEDWRERWRGDLLIRDEGKEGVEGMKYEDLKAFMEPMGRQHGVAMGGRGHIFLEILGTRKEYMKRGLGSMLLKRGCEIADEEGLEMYLDTSKMGKGLYEKFGFVVRDCRDKEAISAPMVRIPKKRQE